MATSALLSSRAHVLRTLIRGYAAGADFLSGVPLKNRGGNVSTADLKNKAIVLYFSAGWCGHCRLFTPKLKKWYDEAARAEGVEVVWVSRDKSASDQVGYYEKALPNVPYIPFGDPHIAQFLKKYEVKTIPTARLVNSKGEVVEMEARNRITEEGKQDAKKLAREFVKLV